MTQNPFQSTLDTVRARLDGYNKALDDGETPIDVDGFFRKLRKAGVHTAEDAQHLTVQHVHQFGVPQDASVLAAAIQKIFVPVVASPAVAKSDEGGGVVDKLVGVLGDIFGGKLDPSMPVDKLLDRLIAGADPTVITFAAEQHTVLATRGVVLKPGAEKVIDKTMTLDYLRQPRTYLGARWKDQRVVAVVDAFGVKEAFNPFNLNGNPLQGDVDPATDLDLTGIASAMRNFFAWITENRPALVKDDGFGLVDVVKEKGLDGIRAHSRFGKAFGAYEEACADDEGLATRYLSRLYRSPNQGGGSGGGGGTDVKVLLISAQAKSRRSWFEQDRTSELHRAAVEAGLTSDLASLLDGMHPSFAASIPGSSMPTAVLLTQISRLNQTVYLADDTVPLAVWLVNAVTLTIGRPQEAIFQRALDDLRRLAQAGQGGSTPSDNELLGMLCKLLESQFGDLVFKLRIPSAYLSGSQAPLATRAREVMQYTGVTKQRIYEVYLEVRAR